MDTQTSPHQQASPGTAHLASGSAFLGPIESSVVEWAHLKTSQLCKALCKYILLNTLTVFGLNVLS